MSTRLLTVDVEIVECHSNKPVRKFQIPDTGDAGVNQQIADLIHRTLLGAPYECTRCSGGDYHFNRGVRFVGPLTHSATQRRGTITSSDKPTVQAAEFLVVTSGDEGDARAEPRGQIASARHFILEIPVDKNGMPFVAPYDCC